ncbi:hypothetical protein PM082_022366 [Marasmius tenuissimus]|nr:hypothetical protein PM082_022366 [Marasmius tenuissimus]
MPSTRSRSRRSNSRRSNSRRTESRRQRSPDPQETPTANSPRNGRADKDKNKNKSKKDKGKDKGKEKSKKRKDKPVTLEGLLEGQDPKKARLAGTRVARKAGEHVDEYNAVARWNAASQDPSISWVQVLYTGIATHCEELAETHEITLPDDAHVEAACIESFDYLMKWIGKKQLLKDLETLLEAGKLGELHDLLDAKANDERGQHIRKVKEEAITYIQDFLGVPVLDPPIKPTAKKSECRGLKHPQLARLLISASMVPDYDKDPQGRVKNGKIMISEQDFGLWLFKNGVYDPSLPYKGLFRSLYLILIWKHLFLGKEAAVMHGQAWEQTRHGPVLRNDLGKLNRRTIAYAIVMGYHALTSSDDWRVGTNGMAKSAIYDAVMLMFGLNAEFEKETIEWWEKYGLMGLSLKKKTGKKKERVMVTKIDDNSMMLAQARLPPQATVRVTTASPMNKMVTSKMEEEEDSSTRQAYELFDFDDEPMTGGMYDETQLAAASQRKQAYSKADDESPATPLPLKQKSKARASYHTQAIIKIVSPKDQDDDREEEERSQGGPSRFHRRR